MLISKFVMFIQFQVVITLSVPWSKKMIRGTRLMRNAVLTAVLACLVAQFGPKGAGFSVIRRGQARVSRVRNREVVIIVLTIAATWSCTKSFWFLRPTDELLSFRSI